MDKNKLSNRAHTIMCKANWLVCIGLATLVVSSLIFSFNWKAILLGTICGVIAGPVCYLNWEQPRPLGIVVVIVYLVLSSTWIVRSGGWQGGIIYYSSGILVFGLWMRVFRKDHECRDSDLTQIQNR